MHYSVRVVDSILMIGVEAYAGRIKKVCKNDACMKKALEKVSELDFFQKKWVYI